MIKLNNSRVKTPGDAYMLRRDGEEIWVDVHPYGVQRRQANARECNLLAAVFLARYSRNNQEEAITFINSYLAQLLLEAPDDVADTLDNPTTIRKYLKQRLLAVPKTFIQVLEWAGVVGDNERNAQALLQYYKPEIFSSFNDAYEVDTRDTGTGLALALNQEFIRIRVGGRYDSNGDGGYYARIGSTGFDWSGLIRESVQRHWKKDRLSFVCVERDSESDTGDPFSKGDVYVYKTADGKDIANMPIEIFLESELSLMASYRYPKPCLEWGIQEVVSCSSSLKKLYSLNANRTRILSRLGYLCLQERKGLSKYIIR